MLILEPRTSDDDTPESETSFGTADSCENITMETEGATAEPSGTRVCDIVCVCVTLCVCVCVTYFHHVNLCLINDCCCILCFNNSPSPTLLSLLLSLLFPLSPSFLLLHSFPLSPPPLFLFPPISLPSLTLFPLSLALLISLSPPPSLPLSISFSLSNSYPPHPFVFCCFS